MKIKSLTLCGVLIAISLVIFVVEAQIPPIVPFPGIKIGLSNIVILFALLYMKPKEVLFILVAKVILSAVFTSAPSTLLYSLAGGVGCLVFELIFLKIFEKKYIWGISAMGAVVHNIFQLIVAFIITKTPQVFFYLPVLIISGLITGLFTGLCIYYFDKKAGNKIM